MTPDKAILSRRAGAVLMVGTILGGWSAPLLAQEAPAETTTAPAEQEQPATADVPAQVPAQPQGQIVAAPQSSGMIRSVGVRGNQRLEPSTIISYSNLQPGQTFTGATLDQALKDLYATELFADVVITGAETGNIVITVQENPVVNRIVLEGNKALKDDKILPEIKLSPRQIFTRSKVRADADRIIELYKREGRFAARVEPKIVQLDQNRVDLVFEIYEGSKSKIRQINIIGNEAFNDGRLIKEMYTREAGGLLGFLKSNDTYDPDRLAADQQKLRAFYLTEGYADFRVVSALAELTPDRRDFIITYVVEEGPRYKFGKIDAESALPDLSEDKILKSISLETGDWFNAQGVENIVTGLTEIAGGLGYAFAEIDPAYHRDPVNHVMDVTFRIADTPRVYVERIDINGNTVTHDKVIRREFRLNEGDAFNAIKIKRSQDRIQSLGYFQENLEIKQSEGSGRDRVVLGLDVQEKATGQLQFSAGYSSLERFIVSLAVQQNNFRGMGQTLGAGIDYSRYSKSVQLSFTEPYLFDKQIALGGQLFRRDYNSFNYIGGERNTTYSQVSTGGGVRLGFPLNEYSSFGLRYSLVLDDVTLDKTLYYRDIDQDGDLECDPLRAGTYLCDELGKRLTSSIGYSLSFDNTNGVRATRGQRATLSQDFAGLGGDVHYLRNRAEATKYWGKNSGWILSAHAEGGYIHPFGDDPASGADPVRLTDRFFGPAPSLRGFDIRGIGPRILRVPYDSEGNLIEEGDRVSDALGGHAYYMGRIEVEIPVSASVKALGIRPSAYIEAGSVWGLKQPTLNNYLAICSPPADSDEDPIVIQPGDASIECPTDFIRSNGYKEEFVGNSPSPRVSVGVGFNWVSPFGPLRLDVAKALRKQRGDDDKLFSFNVGTQF
ncbi:MAG TPA: outer membrane protein assembly factor BamA [Sphingomicrobium sp.]|nr:outer membrane protein assembly factor BamA [Sphingomicrobium sp.]